MPSLTRFIIIIIIFISLIYGGMLALDTFVKPNPSTMTIHISPSDLNIRPWPDKAQDSALNSLNRAEEKNNENNSTDR